MMWSGKLLSRAGRLGHDIILRDTVITPSDNTEEKTKGETILKQINNKTYNDQILVQCDTHCIPKGEKVIIKRCKL